MPRLIARLLCAASLVTASACSSPPIHAVHLPPAIESSTIGPEDVFEVAVYDEVALSRTFRVAPNGTIDFPLIGRLDVDGKEPQQVADVISAGLKERGILKRPSVSVMMREVNSKKITVSGQVMRPGQYPLVHGASVVESISVAGGFTTSADRDRVTLNRKISKDKVIRVVFSAAAIIDGKINDVPLQAGDAIYVEERIF